MRQNKMLPGNFPKSGGLLINLALKFGGIELVIQVHQPRFGSKDIS
jgi:hypothetical protein